MQSFGSLRLEEQKMEIKHVNVDDLVPNESNPRSITEEELAKLMRSIKEFGFKEPVIVNTYSGRENVIVGGHQRIKAVQELKGQLGNKIAALEIDLQTAEPEEKESLKSFIEEMKSLNQGLVPVTYVSLPKVKEEMFNIALNKISGEWDDTKLLELLTELKDHTEDLTLSGFDDKELLALLKEEDKEVTEDETVTVEAYDRLKNKTKIKPGNIFALGNHVLMCGDSTSAQDVSILMNDEKADLVLTDPPFGNNLGYGRGQLGERKILNDENIEILSKINEPVTQYTKDNAHILIWIQWRTFAELTKHIHHKLRTVVVWDKNQAGLSGGGFAEQHEWLCVFTKGSAKQTEYSGNVWRCSRENNFEGRAPHPHIKPQEVLTKAINLCSAPKNVVLDLFGGSGSTLIACEQTERKCHMMELDPVYCAIIIERWEKFTGEKAILLSK